MESLIFGNQKAQSQLSSLLQTKSPGTILLVGPDGIGKFSYAKHLVASLYNELDCEIIQDSIEEVRLGLESINVSAINSRERIILVRDCHKLSESAQDAFLKSCENLPLGCIFIFISSDPSSISSPLLSRIRHTINFHALNDEEILSFAKSLDFPLDEFALHGCRGIPALYVPMAGKPEYESLYRSLLAFAKGELDLFLEPVPQIIKECKELVQRTCVSAVCAYAARSLFVVKPEIATILLHYSRLLIRHDSANAEIHYCRMCYDISSSM